MQPEPLEPSMLGQPSFRLRQLFALGVRGAASRLRSFWCNFEGRSLTAAGSGTRFLPPSIVLNPRHDPSLIQIGQNCVIRSELFCFAHGGRIVIGDDCFLGEGSRIWSAEEIRIGNRVLVSHDVDIHDTSGHPMRPSERFAHFSEIRARGHPADARFPARPVEIGDDAWIGFGSAIRPGVRIGRGAIVGGKSVVTKDVPDFAVVVGNPARLVRTLAPDER
jgi:acetyltransferase-like isoleucine patch superfamily enzyme